MSWLSGLFGGKEQELQPDRPGWAMKAGKSVAEWGKKYIDQAVPGKEYTGQMTAPISEMEKAGQDWLGQYLNQPNTGEGYDLSFNELKKTLEGGYNPFTSPEYKPFKEGAMFELEDTIDKLRRGQGYRGTFFQDSAVREEGRARQATQNYLQQILAGMSERERERKLGAVPQMMELEKYKGQVPLQKATAASSLGALPRLIEQADLETRYKDFLRKQGELAEVPKTLQGVYGTPISYGVKSYETASPFERIMGAVAPIAGKIFGGM